MLFAGGCTGGAIANSVGPMPPDCVIAEIAGTTLTVADAKVLQTQLDPPPELEEAIRLLIDATVAYWGQEGFVDRQVAVPDLLAAYRQLLTASRLNARAAESFVDVAAAEIDSYGLASRLKYGACYTPLFR